MVTLAALNALSGSAQAGAIHMPVRRSCSKDSHCKGLIARSPGESGNTFCFSLCHRRRNVFQIITSPVGALRMISHSDAVMMKAAVSLPIIDQKFCHEWLLGCGLILPLQLYSLPRMSCQSAAIFAAGEPTQGSFKRRERDESLRIFVLVPFK
jgi:hypothetical protein